MKKTSLKISVLVNNFSSDEENEVSIDELKDQEASEISESSENQDQ